MTGTFADTACCRGELLARARESALPCRDLGSAGGVREEALARAVFLYQLVEASFGLFNASANGGGVAFFTHVGGFVFGMLVAAILTRAGQIAPQAR